MLGRDCAPRRESLGEAEAAAPAGCGCTPCLASLPAAARRVRALPGAEPIGERMAKKAGGDKSAGALPCARPCSGSPP